MNEVRFIIVLLLVSCGLARAEPPAGRLVWWGLDPVSQTQAFGHTNGVIFHGNTIASNIVAVAAGSFEALAVRSDGSVLSIGRNSHAGSSPVAGLSNVASVAIEGDCRWAISRDGTVAQWEGEEKPHIVRGLTNITSIAWASSWYRSYLALKNDGTVLGFRLGETQAGDYATNAPAVRPVKVRGELLTNVAALASGTTPLVLKRDGTLVRLGFQTPGVPSVEPRITKIDEHTIAIDFGGESSETPYQYTTADPVIVGGQALSNVTAITSPENRALAIKSNGTLVSLGNANTRGPEPPGDLTNVVAAAFGLALKRDGTVTGWGDNTYGQASVPAGLSNVVAVAAGGTINLAITTGSIPASVFIEPHGRLEEMAAAADLVFKGQALASERYTNAAFRVPQMDLHATKFKVISVLQGAPASDTVIFEHYTKGPGGWGGPHWPPYYLFEVGKSYLIFAAGLDKADKYYAPGPGSGTNAGEFRQIADFPTQDDDGVLRTLDARPLPTRQIKNAHWHELNLLLNDAEPTNKLYAIQHLEAMSLSCAQPWGHSDDFARERVLEALRPLLTDPSEQVAVAALDCFHLGPGCATQLMPHASALIDLGTSAPSIPRRVAAIAAFSGTAFPELTNSIPKWLSDPDEDVRAQAVLLLPDFPGNASEEALRRLAADSSPKVRATVADAIGNGKIRALLPTLAKLFQDPVGRTNPIPPLTLEDVQAGGRSWGTNNADVHTSAGYALLQFDSDQVADILKTNLNDIGFHPNFVCKLAERNAEPWLNELTAVLDQWRKQAFEAAKAKGLQPREQDPRTFLTLSGTYFRCWNIIFDWLQGRPAQEFAGGNFDRYLDALEKAGTTGSREPSMIYGLYRAKGLDQRATKYRRWCEDTFGYHL